MPEKKNIGRHYMLVCNKVSELEWYVCMKAFLESFGQVNGTEKIFSNLDDFHKEWDMLKDPENIQHTIAVYSPINAFISIAPGHEMNLPLGFVLPDDFLWSQIFPDDLLFCNGRISGNANAKGSVLKLVNISDNTISFLLHKDLKFAFGIAKNQVDQFKKYSRLQLTELVPETSDYSLSFFMPGIYDCESKPSYLPSKFYMTVSKKDRVRFMIHYKINCTCDPANDPILDVINVEDVSKYTVKSRSVIPYDIQKLFEKKWKNVAGKNRKEGIRYPFSTYFEESNHNAALR